MAETLATYTVPEHHVIQFTSNVQAALVREGGLLTGLVSGATYGGDKAQVVNFLGPVTFVKRDGPYQDTKVTEPEHTQRWIYADDYDCAIFVDRIDTLRMIYDPTNPYVERMREAAARLQDEVIASAFFATAMVGKQGLTAKTFPAADTIAVGGTRFTVAKLRAARKLLKKRKVKLREATPMIAITAEQADDLLGDTTVTSQDYNTVKALVNGDVDSFMGFRFVQIEDIVPSRTTNGTDLIRQCPVWVPSGMHFGDWQGLQLVVNNRPDKNNIKQIHGCLSFGATRIEEGKVLCLEAQEV